MQLARILVDLVNVHVHINWPTHKLHRGYNAWYARREDVHIIICRGLTFGWARFYTIYSLSSDLWPITGLQGGAVQKRSKATRPPHSGGCWPVTMDTGTARQRAVDDGIWRHCFIGCYKVLVESAEHSNCTQELRHQILIAATDAARCVWGGCYNYMMWW